MADSEQEAAGCSQTNQDDMQEPESKKRKLDAIQVSDRDIADIIRQLCPDDLRKFFYALDLPRRDIEKAEIKAGTLDVDLRARRVLETWLQRNGQQATREKVLCALEECECRNAKEKLEEIWKLKGGSGHQFDLTTCQQELITYYTQEMGTVHLLPWCDDTGRDMDDIYVSLELEEMNVTGTSLLENNEDLVTLESKRRPATRVLVKGVAGSGKSTLLARLAYSWTKHKADSPLSNYCLLFIIALREVGRDCSLVDVIFEQILPEDTKMKKDNLQSFIENNPEKVVILLDGLDEYDYKDNIRKENGIDKILYFKMLRDCRVILSTRPHKHLGKYQNNFVSVNLTGFSPEKVKLYMTRFFHGNTLVMKNLEKRLKDSEILTVLSTIPVILMLMCLLWEDEHKLPDTQSGLYQEFALYLWKKYSIKLGKYDDDDTFETEFEKAMCALGQKAFEGLCPKGNFREEKLIFSEKDFTVSQFELGCETGLITRERLRSKLKMISSVTFLHKSFQEYCAAKYWAYLFDTNPDQIHSILKQIDAWNVLLSKMELLKFSCGVVGKAGRVDIIHHAIHLFRGIARAGYSLHQHYDDKNDIFPILNLLYESQITPSDDDSKTNQQHDQVCAESTILSHDEHQSLPRGRLSLAQALKSLFSKDELKVVYSRPPQLLPTFHNFVKSAFGLSSLSTINSLQFRECPVASLDVITDTLQCMPDVQDIDVSLTENEACEVEQRMTLLGEELSSLSKLNTISLISDPANFSLTGFSIHPIVQALSASSHCLHYTHIKFDGVTFNSTHMAHLLSKTTHLKKLVLRKNEMTSSDVMLLLDAIHSKLEHLILLYNHVAEAIGHIAHIMTPHLQMLNLCGASLNEDHINILSQSLHKAINLKELVLSQNTVRMSVIPLAQQLQYCTRLSILELTSADIPDQGIIELANRFAFMSNLTSTEIDIDGTDVGNGGIHAVFKHLHHLTKLEILQITAIIDNQCSALVKDCLSAIGTAIPVTRSHRITVNTFENPSQVQSLINAASKHAN